MYVPVMPVSAYTALALFCFWFYPNKLIIVEIDVVDFGLQTSEHRLRNTPQHG